MKKRDDFFERNLKEIYDVSSMLDREGKSDAESRAFVVVACLLLFCKFHLRRIALTLLCLAGFVVGKFLSGLF